VDISAATLMTSVTSIDNSKFWRNVVTKGLAVYVILACVCMYEIDMAYSRHPVSVGVCVCVRV